jgi:hypothetical protein
MVMSSPGNTGPRGRCGSSTRLPALLGLVALLSPGIAHAGPCPQPGGKTIAMIIGCENRISDQKWKDYRIAFGVTDLIAQSLYDAGGFALTEGNGDVIQKLAALRSDLWNLGSRKVSSQIAGVADTGTATVMGRLLSCGAPRSDASIGPFHANATEVVVRVEVEMVLPGGKKLVGEGSGSSTRTSVSTLFEFREDKPLFEQTNIGKALSEATRKATADLVAKKRKLCHEDK